MLQINLEIPSAPATKKNSQEIYWRGISGKSVPFVAQSKRYKKYEKHALSWLMQFGNQYIPGPVWVKCLYWLPDKRKRDLTNLMAATHDILEKAGIIEDDALIESVDGSRKMGVDRKNPRVEIMVRQYE